LRLGLAPGTLSQIPGAEEDVFVAGERGLLWSPLRVTGTLDDPKEDLSQRLMAAAGARMFEIIPATGIKVLKYTQQVIGGGSGEDAEAAPKVIDQATQSLKQGTDVIDQAVKGAGGLVGGVVQGLLGGVAEETTDESDAASEKKTKNSAASEKAAELIAPDKSKADAAE
jgi:hypothetical protein